MNWQTFSICLKVNLDLYSAIFSIDFFPLHWLLNEIHIWGYSISHNSWSHLMLQRNQMREYFWHVDNQWQQHFSAHSAECNKKNRFMDFFFLIIAFLLWNILLYLKTLIAIILLYALLFMYQPIHVSQKTNTVAPGRAQDESKGKENGYTTGSVCFSETPLQDETQHACEPATEDPKASSCVWLHACLPECGYPSQVLMLPYRLAWNTDEYSLPSDNNRWGFRGNVKNVLLAAGPHHWLVHYPM